MTICYRQAEAAASEAYNYWFTWLTHHALWAGGWGVPSWAPGSAIIWPSLRPPARGWGNASLDSAQEDPEGVAQGLPSSTPSCTATR